MGGHGTKTGHKSILCALLIILITAISFSPVLKNAFTNWDDPDLLVNNRKIMILSLKAIAKFFKTSYGGFDGGIHVCGCRFALNRAVKNGILYYPHMEKETSVAHPQQNEYAYMEEINEGVLRNIPPRQESGEGRLVLDVGCGYGALAEAIENKSYAVWGIESHDVASALAGKRMTKVIHEDLTNLGAVREAIGERRFDYLVFSDVLEHLHDPDLILRSYLPFLKDSGTVIVSVPNVAAWNIRLRLLFGIFEYADSGILDRTHLRFFTFKTAQKMLRDAGLRVTKKDLTPYLMRSFLPIIKKVFLRSGKGRVDSRRAIIDSTPYRFYLRWIYPLEYAVARVFKSLLAFRIILVGRKNG